MLGDPAALCVDGSCVVEPDGDEADQIGPPEDAVVLSWLFPRPGDVPRRSP
jgi:hypothetical protein